MPSVFIQHQKLRLQDYKDRRSDHAYAAQSHLGHNQTITLSRPLCPQLSALKLKPTGGEKEIENPWRINYCALNIVVYSKLKPCSWSWGSAHFDMNSSSIQYAVYWHLLARAQLGCTPYRFTRMIHGYSIQSQVSGPVRARANAKSLKLREHSGDAYNGLVWGNYIQYYLVVDDWRVEVSH